MISHSIMKLAIRERIFREWRGEELKLSEVITGLFPYGSKLRAQCDSYQTFTYINSLNEI